MKRILDVQKQIGVLGKSSDNPFFKSKYLSLDNLLKHLVPLLHENNLLLLQPIHDGEVCSQVYDAENGKLIAESRIVLQPNSNPQKLGSAITYFRRYTLKSLFAIAEGDDDGNLAATPPPKPKPEPEPIPTPPPVYVAPPIEDFDFEGMIGTFKTMNELVNFNAKYKLTETQKSAVRVKHGEFKALLEKPKQ